MLLNEIFINYQAFICGALGGAFYELIAYYEILRDYKNEEDYDKNREKHEKNIRKYFTISSIIGGFFVYLLSLTQSQIWQLIVGYTAINFLKKLQSK